MARLSYPKNHCISNTIVGEIYLFCLKRKWNKLGKLFGLLLSCDILCPVPERLFMPHPIGIVAGAQTILNNDVVLMQNVTLGTSRPYYTTDEQYGCPTLEEGVYVSPGAKIIGAVTIGKWSVVGANAVVSKNIAPNSIVVGNNIVLKKKSTDLEWEPIDRQ